MNEHDKTGSSEMVRIFLHARHGLLKSIETKLTEWLMGVLMLSWGITFFVMPEVFLKPQYQELVQVIPQAWAAYIFTFVGATRLLILFINGGLSKSPHLRTAASLVSAVIWFQVSVAHNQASETPTGFLTFLILCVGDYAAMLRAARDARHQDEKNRGSL